MPASVTTTRTLGPGLYVQIYRDSIHGDEVGALKSQLDAWGRSPSLAGLAFHSVNMEMSEAEYAPLAKVARDRGLLSLSAWGLGDSHPETYGKTLARYTHRPDCDGVAWDMEGSWENERDDPAKAARMFGAYLAAAKAGAVSLDQCWFIPTYHHAFPWRECAAAMTLRCPQVYHNDFVGRFGKKRYAKVEAWHAESWKAMEGKWARAGIPAVPHTRTIQGYGWSDILPDLVTCLLKAASEVTFVWCHPFPAKDFLRGLAAVDALRAAGFAGEGAVARFQAHAGLKADGIAGPKTFAALGVHYDLSIPLGRGTP